VLKKMLDIRGVGIPYADRRRIEQVRYTLAKMLEDTGVSTHDVRRRMPDFVTHYWTSHHPFLVPEPCTIEPAESYSKQDLDEYVAAIRQVSDEAYASPEFVRAAPHDSTIHRIKEEALDNPDMWAVTWRGYQRKKARGAYGGAVDGQDAC
jgi:glycine dehydrogenase subunit 2